MKKRFFSLFLTAILLLTMLPVAGVSAEETNPFTASDDMIALLKEYEGFDKYPRWDYAHYTVGYGSTCPDADYDRWKANGITEAEAEALLKSSLLKFETSICNFAKKNNIQLNQNKFDALLLFTYNVGTAWMFGSGTFRSAVINGAEGNDFLFAIGQWCKAGGNVRPSLIRRRLAETNMYFNGVYSKTVLDNYCYVIYNANGGTSDISVQCYDSNNPAKLLPTVTREGYTFAGWYTAESGGKKVTVLDASVRNFTLYARWIEGENAEVPENVPESVGPETEKIDPVTVKVTANGVNIRTGPGTNYTAVTRVYSGKQMTITEIATGSGYTWGKFDGGWIALTYTNYKTVSSEKEEKPAETTPPATEAPEETKPQETPKGVMGTVTGSDLRIRSGAGTGYKVLGFLQIGDRVEITEQKTVGSMVWGKMSKGWISLTYVKLDKTEDNKTEDKVEQKPAETTPPATEAPKPTEPEEQKPAAPTAVTGKVNVNDFLRIRKGAGTGYAVVGYLTKNAKVEILETKKVNGTTWGRIAKGWISMDYVILDAQEAEKEETPAAVIKTVKVSDLLRIRKGPGTNYAIVGSLYNGAKVEILETKVVNGTTWGRIAKGWISMDYVR